MWAISNVTTKQIHALREAARKAATTILMITWKVCVCRASTKTMFWMIDAGKHGVTRTRENLFRQPYVKPMKHKHGQTVSVCHSSPRSHFCLYCTWNIYHIIFMKNNRVLLHVFFQCNITNNSKKSRKHVGLRTRFLLLCQNISYLV